VDTERIAGQVEGNERRRDDKQGTRDPDLGVLSTSPYPPRGQHSASHQHSSRRYVGGAICVRPSVGPAFNDRHIVPPVTSGGWSEFHCTFISGGAVGVHLVDGADGMSGYGISAGAVVSSSVETDLDTYTCVHEDDSEQGYEHRCHGVNYVNDL